MPSDEATMRTRVGLASDDCCTSSLLPSERATSIWDVSSWVSSAVATVAELRVTRTNPRMASTTTTHAATLAAKTSALALWRAWASAPWPRTTETDARRSGRRDRSGARSTTGA